ncbi:MAG TPA: glycosyl hydrolase family 65 protein, partial [Defluviitoga tunisiensis]|nr:glycosyl hydrolase family 65 protein [Defluviitoga tunisiensis]HOL87277.1 glycosyl hydrolase family 65 protein [Defluviitoga tunisiensis]HPP10780.1 glycosyl hydrolase family 65 protein [Defluviitoga tunisiensis]
GLSVDQEGVLNFKPWLPEQWKELSFKLRWRDAKLKVDILQDKIVFLSDQTLKIRVFSKDYILEQNKPFTCQR